MRIPLIAALALTTLSFLALPASAACEVATLDAYPDINYATVCALDEGSHGDGVQTFSHAYLLHASHALEADPAFESLFVYADQGTWTYDDGETTHERRWTSIGGNTFWGARGLVGTGAHARLDQRDQTAPEDGWGACSGIVGPSTCVGAGGWFTVQEVASVGVGLYYQQSASGDACRQQGELDVSAGIVFVPILTEPGPCPAELPRLHDEAPFGAITALA